MMRLPPKPGLLSGCALGALLATLPAVAEAQSFAGTPSVVTGDASVTTGPGTTDITIYQPETVINWTVENVAGTTFVFQPTDTTATFEGFEDYTVLNRILPFDGPVGEGGSPIASAAFFDGTVESYIDPEVGGPFIGGQVWFYSPTGIIAGPNALFNVGSLILTTDDISFVENVGSDPVIYGSIYGPDGLVEFNGPDGSAGYVQIQDGAQLNASGTNAYIALVAPRVEQYGFVSADGNIAYIAAEDVDMTINAGLVDFTITTGTTDDTGIAHTGTTTGPASTSSADGQRIMMVALPKNDALTMLLAGDIGYTPAASAVNEGSSVVLVAGFDSADPTQGPFDADGSIAIGTAAFSNQLTGWATNNITVQPDFGTTSFAADTSLNAASSIDLIAYPGDEILADGNLTLKAGVPGEGGDISVRTNWSDAIAPAPLIDIAGNLVLDADSDGILPIKIAPDDGTGGAISIVADTGLIEAANIFASALGEGEFADPIGGTGQGGTIDVEVTRDGAVAAGFVDLAANGTGGRSSTEGGEGIGGRVTVTDNGGQLDFGVVSLTAIGRGGDGLDIGGDGTGGAAIVTINQQEQSWTSLSMNTSAYAGGPLDGPALSGNATGGEDGAILEIFSTGSLDLVDDLTMVSNTYMLFDGVAGFTGSDGKVTITVDDGTLTVGDTLTAEASALFTSSRYFYGDVSTSPTQIGGTVTITAQNGGLIEAAGLDARAEAFGHVADDEAGTATGGEVTVSALSGGTIRIDDGEGTALARISTDAFGGPGPSPAHAQGGLSRIIVEDGDISVSGDLALSANALVGKYYSVPGPAAGFDATGGTASIELREGAEGTANLAVTGDITVEAIGDARLFLEEKYGGGQLLLAGGDDPIPGDGGDGTGGFASVSVAAGTLTTDNLVLDSSGAGGSSGVSDSTEPYRSGDGFGMSSTVTITGGSASVTTLTLLSDGLGGGGAGPAADGTELAALAGNGTGGTAALELSGSGELTATDTTLQANGLGGPGMDHLNDGAATDGGDGTGGTAQLASAPGWTGLFTTATLDVHANGTGGDGGFSDPAGADPALGSSGDGGDGAGGEALVDLADGAFTMGLVDIEAVGLGGDSGDAASGPGGAEGGEGRGGEARFALIDSVGPAGTRSIGELAIEASGFGGFGSDGQAQSGAGSAELTVDVLNPAAALEVTGSLSIFAVGCCIGGGTGIEALISGAPLAVGGDITMVASGPLAIVAEEPLSADGSVALEGLTFTSSGLIQSGGFMSVRGYFGLNADRLTSGDTTSLDSPEGPIVVADLNSAGDVTATGESIDIRSTGALHFLLAHASAGDLFVQTVDDLSLESLSATGFVSLQSTTGDIATNDFSAGTWAFVDAGGSVSLGDVSAALDVGVTARGGNLTVGDVTAGDDIWLSLLGSDAGSLLTAGKLVSTGLGDDSAAGPPVLFGAYPNGAGPEGNVIRVRGAGSLLVGDVTTPGRAILVADQGTMTLGDLSGDDALILLGRGDIALGTATTDGVFYVADSAMFLPNLPDAYDPASLDGLDPLRTTGGLTADAIDAGRVSIAVGTDAILPEVTSGGTTFLSAGGTVDIASLVSAGTVTATAGAIDIASPGALTFDTAQADDTIAIHTQGDLTIAEGSAGGTTLLLADNGDIAVEELLSGGAVTAIGRDVEIASTGALSFAEARATAGDVTVETAGNLTAAELRATGAIDLTAGGTFALTGLARAPTIAVTSADISIGSGAKLGERGTTDAITLTNGESEGLMAIGDGVAGGDWVLDAAEAKRLFADEAIHLVSDGDIGIGDLALTFGTSGNIGTGGTLEVTSPGTVLITGDVALTMSSPEDSFVIDPSLIALDTATGSVKLLGGDGKPLGRLRLVGDTVAAATGAVLDQLDGLTDLGAITDLLDKPGGSGDTLVAGAIEVSVVDGFYVQNSGTSEDYEDRRGFAASALTIETGSLTTQIAINGVILGPAGTVTGLDVAELIAIEGQFDPKSTINGCEIGADCSLVPPPPPPNDELDLIDPDGGVLIGPQIELAGTDPLIDPPVVDEPITGVGNDDLWQPPCEDPEDDGTCPENEPQP